MPAPVTRRPLLPVTAAALLCLLVVACQRPATPVSESTLQDGGTPRTAADVTLQADDRVDLALYFRRGSGESAHLVRVVREVPVTDDLPRRAVELLLGGPAAEDGQDLTAPLPPGTRLLDLRVADGIAHLDLSREVITEAERDGGQPGNELLALAAVADTLTEFPGIEAVRLSVEGRQAGRVGGAEVADFWGGWGLPERLVRDETVVGPPVDGLGMPDLHSFTRTAQQLAGDERAPVTIRSVRVRDHTTFIRVVVEVGDGSDPTTTAPAPPASARVRGDRVVLSVEQVAGYDADVAVNQALDIGDPAFEAVTVERAPGSSVVSFAVDCRGAPQFWLHSLSSPTRILLDIRK